MKHFFIIIFTLIFFSHLSGHTSELKEAECGAQIAEKRAEELKSIIMIALSDDGFVSEATHKAFHEILEQDNICNNSDSSEWLTFSLLPIFISLLSQESVVSNLLNNNIEKGKKTPGFNELIQAFETATDVVGKEQNKFFNKLFKKENTNGFNIVELSKIFIPTAKKLSEEVPKGKTLFGIFLAAGNGHDRVKSLFAKDFATPIYLVSKKQTEENIFEKERVFLKIYKGDNSGITSFIKNDGFDGYTNAYFNNVIFDEFEIVLRSDFKAGKTTRLMSRDNLACGRLDRTTLDYFLWKDCYESNGNIKEGIETSGIKMEIVDNREFYKLKFENIKGLLENLKEELNARQI